MTAAVSFGMVQSTAQAAGSSDSVPPNADGSMVDCNGWSPTYPAVVPNMKMRCTDPIALYGGAPAGKFYDNGHYVGHDEPSVKFESSVAGSGNTMTYFMQLSHDPAATPTATLTNTVSDYAELSPAPWFGLAMCDPRSNPGGACTPDSDTNNPNTAGSAFMELQWYPPKFSPWLDGPSCDQTRWCVALNIDSLTSPINNSCVEPVNFAFLTTDGSLVGPPSPQLSDLHTFTASSSAKTFYMNDGDTLEVQLLEIPDPAGTQNMLTDTGGLETRVLDLTTGQSGFMISSASNGFKSTQSSNCAGFPYSFHGEYSTAKQANITPWAALEGGVLMQDEVGHFEPCSSLSSPQPLSFTFSDGTFTDNANQEVCNGGFEGTLSTGEGPCNTTTLVCTGATQEGPTYGGAPCATNSLAVGGSCEFADAFCIPSGPRTVSDLTTTSGNWPVSGCQQNEFQNGDLDFDGSTYVADWPDGNANHPTSFRYLGPFDPAGNQYPNVQFETDGPGSEANCQPSAPTPATCKEPPDGAMFYPFWSITNLQGLSGVSTAPSSPCVWNFGNDIAGVTTNDFGKDVQYGTASAHYGGTLISAVTPNPTINGNCPSVTLTGVSVNPNSNVPEAPWMPAVLGAGVIGIAGAGAYRRRRRADKWVA